ncbi:MAG: hypothetical protein J0H32_06355, partial [Rhizobiales bacterium]|nr:hypothetical protein [Hyphomicrobiales bacterium]
MKKAAVLRGDLDDWEKRNRTGHLQEVRHHRRLWDTVLMAGKSPRRRRGVKHPSRRPRAGGDPDAVS